jgi:hypothetical protein
MSSCIYVRNRINALLLLEFCSTDATTVRIIYAYGGDCDELTFAPAWCTLPFFRAQASYIIRHPTSLLYGYSYATSSSPLIAIRICLFKFILNASSTTHPVFYH